MHPTATIALVLVALAVGGFVYLGYPILRAVHASKDLMERAAPYEQHPASATMRILIAGDSTAYGTGAARPEDSLAGRLGADFPQADIENVSQNGLRLEGLNEKLSTLESGAYDLVILQIGANDIVGFTALQKVRSELVRALDHAEELGSAVVVITSGNIGLSPVFKAPISALLSERTRAVRSIFQEEIAKRQHVAYVDLYKNREDEPFNRDIPRYYASDLFHPSGDGYGLWYQELKPLLPSSLAN